MFDGFIHIIPGVRQVLNLRKSLLSLGKFDKNGCELFGKNGQLIMTKEPLVVANGELKDGQYRLIRKTIVSEAGVVSVMAESLTIYHKYLRMTKPRLEGFHYKILFESKTTNYFLPFIVENTTLKAPIEYYGGIKNCVDEFS